MYGDNRIYKITNIIKMDKLNNSIQKYNIEFSDSNIRIGKTTIDGKYSLYLDERYIESSSDISVLNKTVHIITKVKRNLSKDRLQDIEGIINKINALCNVKYFCCSPAPENHFYRVYYKQCLIFECDYNTTLVVLNSIKKIKKIDKKEEEYDPVLLSDEILKCNFAYKTASIGIYSDYTFTIANGIYCNGRIIDLIIYQCDEEGHYAIAISGKDTNDFIVIKEVKYVNTLQQFLQAFGIKEYILI